ncbi:uncharacterized protein DUF222 [Glaciihabitans tibetensis]|uniref:Uncharacterized protein DUF222 n=1 Tax=Glaciihabitans tibetensis TaxID=1266600 RepID=A0A2T0VAL5_9MICO|nr:HNH endonuclease signature motif containing protein [Glaciihabitans tibetensis]PRY67232.1 uncharacterized protein DUF222 [Glaciihabitans tibetensis]
MNRPAPDSVEVKLGALLRRNAFDRDAGDRDAGDGDAGDGDAGDAGAGQAAAELIDPAEPTKGAEPIESLLALAVAEMVLLVRLRLRARAAGGSSSSSSSSSSAAVVPGDELLPGEEALSEPEPVLSEPVVSEPVLSEAAVGEPAVRSDPVRLRASAEEFHLSQDFLDAGLAAERASAAALGLRARQLDAARQHAERAVFLKENPTDPRRSRTNGSGSSGSGSGGKAGDGTTAFAGWTKSEIAFRGFAAMVATQFHITERAAENLIATSTTLVHLLPATLAALEAGEISYRNADILVTHSYRVPDEHRQEYETILLPFAAIMTPTQFDRKARRLADSYQPDALEQRHEEAVQRRQLSLTPLDDGMAELRLYIDAIDATAIASRATAIAQGMKHPADPRTLSQLRADAATHLLLTGTTPTTIGTGTGTSADGSSAGTGAGAGAGAAFGSGLGSGIVAHVAIQVPVLSLLGHDTEPATLEGYGPITMDRARQLMGTATSFTRILTHPETGTILTIGTTRYKVPAAMRLWLMTRDLTCRFPGCMTPARNCDLDHTLDWQYGGATDATNLASLCPAHHDLKHHTDWNYTQDKHGVCTWTSPTGTTHTTTPETRLHTTPPQASPTGFTPGESEPPDSEPPDVEPPDLERTDAEPPDTDDTVAQDEFPF